MLMRAFSKVDDDGRIAIGRHLWRQLCLTSGGKARLWIVKLKGSSRKPYLFVYKPGGQPRLNEGLERIVWEGLCLVDEAGRLCLGQQFIKDFCPCFAPDARAELKLVGPGSGPWLAIRWRGPAVASTLQERMNVRGLARSQKSKRDKWSRMRIDY